MKARQVGHRLTVCWMTLALLSVTWWEPESLSFHLIHYTNGWGHALSYLMAIMAVIGIADAIVNDVLPDKYSIPWVGQYRHIGYVILAVAHMVFVYVMARNHDVTWLAAQFITVAVGCIWIASFDTYYHRVSQRNG